MPRLPGDGRRSRMTERRRQWIGIACFALGLAFIGVGLFREEHLTVLKKAVAICLECIGIG
ncbi:CD1871A family CXXC motif-containing protein [Beduinella massiliensis]|uniref:CD1871A family CXXC motif-containing protein n=1 Tax=Beduinella massiliensis TaxID=1852363 RepID=UPI003D1562BE